MKSTKDKVIMGIRIIVGLALMGYVAYLFTNNLQIVQDSFASYNMFMLGFIGIIGLLILIMGIIPLYIPRMRTMQFLAGIALILFANYCLKDDPSKLIFLRDITNILGAFWTIAGPTGICVLDCVKKQIEEKTVEIIEV